MAEGVLQVPHRILVINPGATSTKVAFYEDESCRFQAALEHWREESFAGIPWEEQAAFREKALRRVFEERDFPLASVSALAVRGGLLRPLPAGVYGVNEAMVRDLSACRFGRHASNLGAIIGRRLSQELAVPAFIVDPVTVDEFEEPARFSGLKGLPRLSMSHALNTRAVARKAAAAQGRRYEDMNLVVAHLGSGISVSAHRRGRMIDVNNANNEGPFSLERTGTLPALGLIRLCFSGDYDEAALVGLVTDRGGVFSYLGTKSLPEVEGRIAAGDAEAARVLEAMAYQVGKEIGAMAAVLSGEVDRIVLTGGMANSELLVGQISRRISFIAPVTVMPGEEEMEALARGVLRVLRGEEEALTYD